MSIRAAAGDEGADGSLGSMDEQVDQIVEGLAEDPVWVHPSLVDRVTPEVVQEMRDDAAAAPTPVYLVVHPLLFDGAFGGDAEEMLTRVHDASDEPGTYVGARELDGGLRSVAVLTWGVDRSPYALEQAVNDLHPDDPVAGVAEAADILANDRLDEAVAAGEAARAERREETGATQPGDDGVGGLPDSLLWGTGLVLLVAVLVQATRAVRARRRPRAAYALPPSVVARVRDAHDQRLLAEATAETQALGEQLDEREIGAADDRSAWADALDHYDAARRVLERGGGRPEVLDVVGALVLARRGRAALRAALDGRPARPFVVCFLNPLHPRPRGDRSVEVGGRAVQVPLCEDCRRRLERGGTPDTLDVLRGGEPVHYFETDAHPWAETGYGALHDDLVRRLHTRR